MSRMAWACFSEKAKRAMRFTRAASAFSDFLMIAITSSMLSSAIFSPRRMWARSSAFGQVEARPPGHHFLAVRDEVLEHLLQGERLRQALHEGEVVDAEGGLKLRVGEELVQDDLRRDALPQVDDDPHAVPVRFVVQVDDAVDLLLLHEVGDPHDQG